MTFKNERKKKEMKEEFKRYKATVHLKHTGTELICDVIAEEEGIIVSLLFIVSFFVNLIFGRDNFIDWYIEYKEIL